MAKINYEKLPERVCEYCKKSYKPTGPAQKACTSCDVHLKSITRQVYRDIARFRKFKTYDSIGSGGLQLTGKESPYYKNGIGLFTTIRGDVREEIRYCEDCGKDLIDVSRWEWCCHHIDHDRSNNERDNFKLLCKSCHNRAHNHVTNIKSSIQVLSEEEAIDVCELFSRGYKQKDLRDMGYPYTAIQHIKRRSSWVRISKDYEF